MNTHSKKRAFTIVELIIVIAVIGVLAAILIPAFTNIIEKANHKSALSDARSALTNFLAANLEIIDGTQVDDIVIFVNKAKKFYTFGYSLNLEGEFSGKLAESSFNPYSYESLVEMVAAFNCTEADVVADNTDGKAFCLTPATGEPTDNPVTDEEILNNDYQNVLASLSNLAREDIPSSILIYEGFLLPNTIVAPGTATGGTGGDPTNPDPTDQGGGTPTEEPLPPNTYKVDVTLQDAFNDLDLGIKPMLITFPEGETTFTLNDDNFFDVLNGYLPYSEFTYTQEFTLENGEISPSALTLGVIPIEIIDGVYYGKVFTAHGLQAINHFIGYLEGNFKVQNDIDCSGTFTQIGYRESESGGLVHPFQGIFDGGNYEITGLNINCSGIGVGLFARNLGTVKNVVMRLTETRQIYGENLSSVGAIVGRNGKDQGKVGTVSNCVVYTSAERAIEGTSSVGLIAGLNDGVVEDCRTESSTYFALMGKSGVGGIVGTNADGGIVRRCTSQSDPCLTETGSKAGGIAGVNEGAIIECGVTGTVNFGSGNTRSTVGGIAGYSANSSYNAGDGLIENCYYANFIPDTVTIVGGSFCGGLVGQTSSNAIIKNSYVYTAKILPNSFNNLGVGDLYNSTVENCYLVGFATAPSHNLTGSFETFAQLKAATAGIWDWDIIWSDASEPYSLKRAKY